MKTHINITIDLDAYLKARKENINISQLLSDYLAEYTNTKTLKDKPANLKDEERLLKIAEEKIKTQLKAINQKKIRLDKAEDKKLGVKKWIKL